MTENAGRGTDKRMPGARAWLTALPLGDGPAADLPLGHALAALDAQWVFLAEKAASGQEERLRNFARVLRALPVKEAPALLAADGLTKAFGVVVRSIDDGPQSFLEIANNSPYPVRLAGRVDLPAAAQIEDLGRGLRLKSMPQADGSNLVLDLLPYGVAAIRIAAPQVKFSLVNSYPSEAVMTGMRTRFNELSAQLARLNHGLSATPVGPANPGFEPEANTKEPGAQRPDVGPARAPATGKNDLAGWLAESTMPGGASIAVDTENPHSGKGSLRLSSPTAYSSVVSESFVPNTYSSLTIEAYFRASAPDTKVRVWIEGESAGKPYVRRTEMTVSTAWEGRAVRASDVPAGGLEKARLRFELLAPANLWIDDLHVPSETTSRSGLVNARRTLLEAIQAYREERYAEFARLAGSHWIQESSAAATTRLARAPEPASRPGGGPARRTAPNLMPYRRIGSAGRIAQRKGDSGCLSRAIRFASRRSRWRRLCAISSSWNLTSSSWRSSKAVSIYGYPTPGMTPTPHWHRFAADQAWFRQPFTSMRAPADWSAPETVQRFEGLCRLAKSLSVAVITMQAAPRGSSIDEEVKRLTIAGHRCLPQRPGAGPADAFGDLDRRPSGRS